jgi:hypothetical protein
MQSFDKREFESKTEFKKSAKIFQLFLGTREVPLYFSYSIISLVPSAMFMADIHQTLKLFLQLLFCLRSVLC